MVDAIVSSLLEQLISVAADKVKQQVRLVTGVREEVKKLTSNLQAIRAVLEDAEQRQMQQDKAVTFWLDQLKDASYDMEDVLDEWVFARLKLQIEGVDDDNAFSLAPHKKKVLKSLKAKHLWADHIFQLTKQFDVGTIMQVCRVSSSRVVRAFAVNLAARAIAHSSEYNFGFSSFRGKVFDASTMAVKRHIKFGTF